MCFSLCLCVCVILLSLFKRHRNASVVNVSLMLNMLLVFFPLFNHCFEVLSCVYFFFVVCVILFLFFIHVSLLSSLNVILRVSSSQTVFHFVCSSVRVPPSSSISIPFRKCFFLIYSVVIFLFVRLYTISKVWGRGSITGNQMNMFRRLCVRSLFGLVCFAIFQCNVFQLRWIIVFEFY